MHDTMDAKLQQLGDLPLHRRIALGLSGREVARRADVDINTYFRLE